MDLVNKNASAFNLQVLARWPTFANEIDQEFIFSAYAKFRMRTFAANTA